MLALASATFRCGLADGAEPPQRIITLMPVGDSITEGGSRFPTYRLPLWEKLFAAGYLVDYVGTRSSDSRIGPLKHEGYGGKTIEEIETRFEAAYRANPADVILLHAGHNHFDTEKPVAGIVAATESIIRRARSIRPGVSVLVAQVIPSGKLPKYSYIPELNEQLGDLARRLNAPGQRVIAVDMADGWNWRTDTVADRVHPNAAGAGKMAERWCEALEKILPPPAERFDPEIIAYKHAGDSRLNLHIFRPAASLRNGANPAIVFFFGGGWRVGTPLQFYRECAHFARRGFVAMSADYRIGATHGTTPFECVTDGKSAIRWVRAHARELGVDPARIAAAGASAGGHVAAAAGLVPGLDDPAEDASVSARPDALLLWYPVVDNGPDGYGPADLKKRYREISPLHNIRAGAPPTLFFLGTEDPLVPVTTAREFQRRMTEAGARCELKLYEGRGHPIYRYREGPSADAATLLREADQFLESLGFTDRMPPP